MEPTDRRARRTRRRLQEALSRLLLKHRIQDITVQQVTKLAGINRSTFYLHYKDLYDLRQQMEGELIRQLENTLAQPEASAGMRELVNCLYGYFAERRELCRPLLPPNGDSPFWRKCVLTIAARGLPALPLIPEGNPLRECQLTFLGSGLMGILQEWVAREAPALPREEAVGFLTWMMEGMLRPWEPEPGKEQSQ